MSLGNWAPRVSRSVMARTASSPERGQWAGSRFHARKLADVGKRDLGQSHSIIHRRVRNQPKATGMGHHWSYLSFLETYHPAKNFPYPDHICKSGSTLRAPDLRVRIVNPCVRPSLFWYTDHLCNFSMGEVNWRCWQDIRTMVARWSSGSESTEKKIYLRLKKAWQDSSKDLIKNL